MRFFAGLCLCIFLASAPPAVAEMVVEGWHEADTPVEQALDKILKTADDDNNVADYVLGTPFYKPGQESVYAPMFTSNFINRMEAEESDKVATECDGHYLPDKVCGFDYNPITCTEDHLPAYYYRLAREDSGSVVILFSVSAREAPYAAYTMTNQAGTWRLDALQCLALPSS